MLLRGVETPMARKYRLLIGGIGDDAHSVGIHLLALGFREEGFHVTLLGIRNDLSDFAQHARDYDIVMISNTNGHAELYLENFGYVLNSLKLANGSNKLWYLGGNLSVSESDHVIKKKFINMGFTNVFPKPVSFEHILDEIKRDLNRYEIKQKEIARRKDDALEGQRSYSLETVSDEKWSYERLATEREKVLTEWETGNQVRASFELDSAHSPEKSLDRLLWRAKVNNRLPLLQPRTGVASLPKQIEILKYLEEAGLDIASVQLDAASRSKLYDKARIGVEMSEERNHSLLNGFPVPIHGVSGLRKLVDSIKRPFQLRAGGPDHRFTYEIALKGGTSGVEGGFICYLFPYDKLLTPSQSLNNWQYVDRLSALYQENYGASINREYFGTLTANLIEPSIAIVVNVIQAILSAKQGVKSMSVGYAEQGNRSQDIAALQIMEEMTNKYLLKHAQTGCRVTTVFHQFMAAFPKDELRAEELICNSARTAALAGATKIMTKTPVEAIKIPSMEENAKGLSIARRGCMSATIKDCDLPSIEDEKRLLRSEVNQMMDAIEELGNGSIARGAIRAFQEGHLDIPFSPNIHNRSRIVTLRDKTGAVRFADFGGLPFDSRLKEFHQEKIDERKNLERDSRLFSLLEKDLTRIWKGDYHSWPLDNSYVF
jgi:methylaspartate mutase epsilon subunit